MKKIVIIFVYLINHNCDAQIPQSAMNDYNYKMSFHAIYNVTTTNKTINDVSIETNRVYYDLKSYGYFPGRGDSGVSIQLCAKDSYFFCYQVSNEEFVIPSTKKNQLKSGDSWCSAEWKYDVVEIFSSNIKEYTLYETKHPFYKINARNILDDKKRSFIYNFDYGVILYASLNNVGIFEIYNLISNRGLLSYDYMISRISNDERKIPVNTKDFSKNCNL